LQWEEVFDLRNGEFTVPAGGSGEYLISATVVMDVHSYQAKLNTDRMVISHYRLVSSDLSTLNTAIQVPSQWLPGVGRCSSVQ
jgi:hypothetical protein